MALVMDAAHPVPTKVCRHNSRWGGLAVGNFCGHPP
jgi:hypothetical protein